MRRNTFAFLNSIPEKPKGMRLISMKTMKTMKMKMLKNSGMFHMTKPVFDEVLLSIVNC
jgi:hypothetical protein